MGTDFFLSLDHRQNLWLNQVIHPRVIMMSDDERYAPPEMLHAELSEQIIGAAMRVLNALKPGLDEKLYENALVIELMECGLRVEQQKSFPVHYKGHFIGKLVPDLIVNNCVIVDPKVVETFNNSHLAQMLGYLSITEFNLALLLNFKHAKLKWKRVVK